MKTQIALLLLVFGSLGLSNFSPAWAESCSAVDISAEMGPIRNQGDIGWCYANAAADMLSHQYRKELKGQQVSALYTALLFNQTFYENTFLSKAITKFNNAIVSEGGSIKLAMDTAIARGFCPRTKDDEFIKNGKRVSITKKLKLGLNLKKLYDQKKMRELQATIKQIRATSTILNSITDNRIYQILADSTSENFLLNVADELCEGAKFMPRYKVDTDLVLLPRIGRLSEPLFWKMDYELTRKRPVGISYHAIMFESFTAPIPVEDMHASVVVGREMRIGPGASKAQCHYKIRNSWGAGCNYKNPAFQGKGCDEGHVWVSKEQFRRYLYAVISVQDD